MNDYTQAFILGNQAILTNVCLLPLYPGLIAFLTGSAGSEHAPRAGGWLGLLVLAGILSMMLLVGLVLFLFRQSFGAILPVLLPVIYGVVIVLGGLMLLGRNPFARLRVVQTPVLSNPYITAYLYGLLLGPMTLPCTGPLITSAFVLGAGSATMLADGLLYFLFFGLGFGWPLIVLPWLALPVQRRFTHWLSKNHQLLARVSGLVLVIIGVYGLWTELIPNI